MTPQLWESEVVTYTFNHIYMGSRERRTYSSKTLYTKYTKDLKGTPLFEVNGWHRRPSRRIGSNWWKTNTTVEGWKENHNEHEHKLELRTIVIEEDPLDFDFHFRSRRNFKSLTPTLRPSKPPLREKEQMTSTSWPELVDGTMLPVRTFYIVLWENWR